MKLTIAALSSILAAGCATQGVSNSSYMPTSTKPVITNEVAVNGQYSAVWDGLVRNLAKSFYVINNIDKESRIINVSFSSTKAEDYVDCGRTQRTFKEGDAVESFNYAVAARSKFKVAAPRQEHPAFSNYAVFTREPALEGRANIYVAPSATDTNRTIVSVNTRYVLTIKVRGESFAKHIAGNVIPRGRLPEETYTSTFNTNSSSSFDAGSGVNVVCFATGALEREILGLL